MKILIEKEEKILTEEASKISRSVRKFNVKKKGKQPAADLRELLKKGKNFPS